MNTHNIKVARYLGLICGMRKRAAVNSLGATPEEMAEIEKLMVMNALKEQWDELKWNLKKPWPLKGFEHVRPGPGAPVGRYAPAALLGLAGAAGVGAYVGHKAKKRRKDESQQKTAMRRKQADALEHGRRSARS